MVWLGVSSSYLPGNAMSLAADPSLAGVDNPSDLLVAGTAAGIEAVVDTGTADTVADRTEVVVDRMPVDHTVVAAVVENNPVDHTAFDTAAAVVGIAQTA